MLIAAELNRYNRQILLPEIGLEGQEKLKQAKVLVVGSGGLGCPALQYLAAAGVGTIGIADFDLVAESNLHRQILYTPEDCGKPKTEIGAQKLKNQNPFITCIPHSLGITVQNALEIIGDYDLVIDGSDNFPTRYLVNDACAILQKPLVFGSIFRFEGQVTVFHFQQGPSYRCLFPEPPSREEVPTCSEAGVLGVLPGIIGTMQAAEAIKIICGIGKVLSGKLFIFNCLTLSPVMLEFERTSQAVIQELQESYDVQCDAKQPETFREISAAELKTLLQQPEQIQLIDVREKAEFEHQNLNGLLLPLSDLENKLNKIDPAKTIVVHCKSGSRSRKAIEILQQYFPETELYNLTGGLDAFQMN